MQNIPEVLLIWLSIFMMEALVLISDTVLRIRKVKENFARKAWKNRTGQDDEACPSTTSSISQDYCPRIFPFKGVPSP